MRQSGTERLWDRQAQGDQGDSETEWEKRLRDRPKEIRETVRQ